MRDGWSDYSLTNVHNASYDETAYLKTFQAVTAGPWLNDWFKWYNLRTWTRSRSWLLFFILKSNGHLVEWDKDKIKINYELINVPLNMSFQHGLHLTALSVIIKKLDQIKLPTLPCLILCSQSIEGFFSKVSLRGEERSRQVQAPMIMKIKMCRPALRTKWKENINYGTGESYVQ